MGMVQIIREFVIREEARGPFELAFGPGGAWSRLFARSAGFQGITLLRDVKNPRRYLMGESWGTEAQREQALTERRESTPNWRPPWRSGRSPGRSGSIPDATPGGGASSPIGRR